MPDEEKETIKSLTFILNKFGVSLEAYHEITQLPGNKEMARSYMVEGCQSYFDDQLEVTKTPGPFEGAELNLKVLLKEALNNHVCLPKYCVTICLL